MHPCKSKVRCVSWSDLVYLFRRLSMDLPKTISKGYTKKTCARVVRWIGSDPNRFAELMDLVFNAESRISQRAAWPMSYCVMNYPDLIKPWMGRIVVVLEKKRNPSCDYTEYCQVPTKCRNSQTIPGPYHERLFWIYPVTRSGSRHKGFLSNGPG